MCTPCILSKNGRSTFKSVPFQKTCIYSHTETFCLEDMRDYLIHGTHTCRINMNSAPFKAIVNLAGGLGVSVPHFQHLAGRPLPALGPGGSDTVGARVHRTH